MKDQRQRRSSFAESSGVVSEEIPALRNGQQISARQGCKRDGRGA